MPRRHASRQPLQPNASLGWPQDSVQYRSGCGWRRRNLDRLADLITGTCERLRAIGRGAPQPAQVESLRRSTGSEGDIESLLRSVIATAQTTRREAA